MSPRPPSATRSWRAVAAREGRVDILVNDAGLQHVSPLHEFPPERFEYLLRVMLLGPTMLMRGPRSEAFTLLWRVVLYTRDEPEAPLAT